MGRPGDGNRSTVPIAQAYVEGAHTYSSATIVEATPVPAVDDTPITRPPLQAQYSTDALDQDEIRRFLDTCRWPRGLTNTIIKCLRETPIRFFICDDSGSMNSSDGNIFINGRKVQTTRWRELSESLQFHIQLALHSRCPTEFRFLNSSDPITIGAQDGDEDRVAIINSILEGSPDGGTPLCQHIRAIVQKLQMLTPQLRRDRRRASLVICTDGESSDGE